MKTNAMKKALLVLGLGLGLSATLSGFATAAPDEGDCEDLRALCAQGNANACRTLAGLSHYC
ncbi:MAG: hypothetical protein MJK04_13170 [Psychrosphaera sp.]|nr:hypothetical protein [Psychrosphaera sp.]NQZ09530.1 hypothetical protein [Algicola sp.]